MFAIHLASYFAHIKTFFLAYHVKKNTKHLKNVMKHSSSANKGIIQGMDNSQDTILSDIIGTVHRNKRRCMNDGPIE